MLHRNILLSLILVSSFFNFILISKGGPEGHVEGSPGVTQAPDTVGGQSSGSALLDALGSGHFDGPPKTYTVPELGGPDVEPTGGPHVEGPGNHDGGDELPPGNPGDVPDPTAGQPVDQPTLPGVDPTGETPGRTPVGPDTGPVMGPTGDPTIGSGPMGDLSQSSPYGLVRQADAILAAKGSRYDASVLFKQAADGYMAEYKKNPTSENFKSAVDAIYEATGSFQKVYDDSGWFSKKLPWGKAKKASEAQVDLTKMLEDINSFNEGQSDSFLKEYSTDTPVEKKKLEEAVQKIKDISEISFDILNRMDRVSPEFSKQLRALNEFLARPEVTKILDAHLEASRPTVDETPITGPGEHGGESGDEPGEKGPEGEEFLEDEEAEEAFFDAEDGSPEEKKIAEAEEKAAAIMVEATVGASATMETVRTPEELQEEALDDQIGFGADFFEIGVGEGILETVGGVVVSAADYARTAWNFVSPGVAKAVEVGSSIIRSTSGFVGRKLDDIGQILEPLGDLGRYGVEKGQLLEDMGRFLSDPDVKRAIEESLSWSSEVMIFRVKQTAEGVISNGEWSQGQQDLMGKVVDNLLGGSGKWATWVGDALSLSVGEVGEFGLTPDGRLVSKDGSVLMNIREKVGQSQTLLAYGGRALRWIGRAGEGLSAVGSAARSVASFMMPKEAIERPTGVARELGVAARGDEAAGAIEEISGGVRAHEDGMAASLEDRRSYYEFGLRETLDEAPYTQLEGAINKTLDDISRAESSGDTALVGSLRERLSEQVETLKAYRETLDSAVSDGDILSRQLEADMAAKQEFIDRNDRMAKNLAILRERAPSEVVARMDQFMGAEGERRDSWSELTPSDQDRWFVFEGQKHKALVEYAALELHLKGELSPRELKEIEYKIAKRKALRDPSALSKRATSFFRKKNETLLTAEEKTQVEKFRQQLIAEKKTDTGQSTLTKSELADIESKVAEKVLQILKTLTPEEETALRAKFIKAKQEEIKASVATPDQRTAIESRAIQLKKDVISAQDQQVLIYSGTTVGEIVGSVRAGIASMPKTGDFVASQKRDAIAITRGTVSSITSNRDVLIGRQGKIDSLLSRAQGVLVDEPVGG